MDRFQLFLGRPTFLLSCGWECKACRATLSLYLLRVWPIQRHFLRLTDVTMVYMLVLSSSSLLITFGHRTPKMYLRHLLTKTCSLLWRALVKRHVSQPYRRTDLTLVENILSLVFRESCLESHTSCKALNAYLALPILTLISLSVPPSVLMTFPRSITKLLY